MIIPIILAAGESSRMGQPKPLIKINGETFLQRLISICESSKKIAGDIFVVLGSKAEEIQKQVDLSKCKVVINENYKNGQLSSINTAIRKLPKEGVDGILLCLVDHPYINSYLIDQMIDTFYKSDKGIIVPTFKGKRGHPTIFSKRLLSKLLAASTKVGARDVLWKNPDEILEIATEDKGILKDVDYPSDIE